MSDMTQPQIIYVQALQHKLRLTDRQLDAHCGDRYGVPFAAVTKRQASDLIDEMTRWKSVPAELQRVAGQQDLPGLGGTA